MTIFLTTLLTSQELPNTKTDGAPCLTGPYIGLSRCYTLLPKPYVAPKDALHWVKPMGM